MKASGAGLVTTLVLATACADTAAENLLPNPSFEDVTPAPVGWVSRAWQGTEGSARWEIVSTGRTGRCLSIRSTGGADAAWTATIALEPRTFYRLSGWIRTRNVKGARGALLNIQNLPGALTQAVTGSSDWQEVSTVFRTGPEPTTLEINCLFGGWGSSTGQAWYDDVAVKPVDLREKQTMEVRIDTGTEPKPYSPMVFGGFLEHFGRQIYGGVFEPGSPLADESGFRTDVLEALRELRVPVVRWPGGCYASGYHWREGVGAERRTTDDIAWGVPEPNTFGTDEFVALCRRMGWEPYICNNAGNGTIAEMREWVEYCNGTDGEAADLRRSSGHAAPLAVPIWSIGNENWGSHEIGSKTPEEWAPFVREAAEAMRDADPTIKLTVAALTDRRWTLPLLEAAGEYLDYISIHNYWIPNWAELHEPSYLDCMMEAEGPETLIGEAVDILDESGYRDRVKIAFDEWNLRSWHHPGFPRKTVQDYEDPEVVRLVDARGRNLDPALYTMADALFSASFLNACLRHAEDVGMANIAPLVNTTGPLYVHPEGIVRRTHFHAIAMYANLLGSHIAETAVDAGMLVHGDRFVPVADAVATVDETGRVWSIALVNRHPSGATECTVLLGDVPLSGAFQATLLVGDSPDAYNDIEHPDRVEPVDGQLIFREGQAQLPPHSLAIVRVTQAPG